MSKSAKVKPENEVNAYLFYAHRLLSLQKSTLLIENKADQMALTASICLSLKQAWQAWLRELSVYVDTDISDYTSLHLPENAAYPEVQVLLTVTKNRGNWVSQLQKFCEPRLNTPPVFKDLEDEQPEGDVTPLKINVVQLEEPDHKALSEEEQLAQVLDEFKAYINTVRSRQAEW